MAEAKSRARTRASLALCTIMTSALMSGCATAPGKVTATYVSPDAYSAWSCERLGAESQKVSKALEEDTARQNRTRIVDGVGLVLVLLPVGSLTGGNHSRDLAELAGKQNALWRAESNQNCILDGKGDLHASSSSKTHDASTVAPAGAS